MDFSFITDPEQRQVAETNYAKAQEEVNKTIETKIAEATFGLKTKNEELLTEKKKIQATLKDFENLDPAAAREALKFLEENEDAKLIKEGRISELVDKKTTSLRTQHEETVTKLSQDLNENKKNASFFKEKYETKVISDGLRDFAVKAGVRVEALDDIILRGKSIFTLDPHGNLEARGQDGKLIKTEDDKILSPDLWVEGLKKVAPHYWPASKGLDAFRGDPGTPEYDTALAEAASKGDMVTYRKLRDKKKKA